MIRNASRRLNALLSALLLTGCSIGPEYKKPDVAVPTSFRSQIAMTEAVSFADQPWWGVFQDKALQDLIKDALINNNDLQQAVARIQQARAQVEIVNAESLPQVGYQLNGGGERSVTPAPRLGT